MSVRNALKSLASKLPETWQSELKRIQFSRQIRKSRFVTDEQEFRMLDRWVRRGDWVLDIGANIGHYTARLSELVGPEGRVIAFEPVPETFELLAANVAKMPLRNVTLLNVGASNRSSLVGVSIPRFGTGLKNYYMAELSSKAIGMQVMTISVDSLQLPDRVSLVKIDTEGHEMRVLEGLKSLIVRDCPTLIIEDSSKEIAVFLKEFGYKAKYLEASSNRIFERNTRTDNSDGS